jgi:hypothetical protein
VLACIGDRVMIRRLDDSGRYSDPPVVRGTGDA